MRPLLLALALFALAAQEPPVRLPESPAARSFAGVGPQTEPHALEDWLAASPWLTESEPDPRRSGARGPTGWLPSPARSRWTRRRAGSLAIACKQTRWADAWTHFERLGGHPAWQAAMMPYLFPGVPIGHGALPGGVAAPIANDTLLRPALPPVTVRGDDGRFPPRVVRANGVTIGDALCDLVLEFEGGGITLEIYHRSGGTGTLRADLPIPYDAQVFVDYVDWDRQDVKGAVLELTVEPREDEYTLYRRLKAQRDEFPGAPSAGKLPAEITRNGLQFVVAEAAGIPDAQAFADACARLLDIEVRVATQADADETGGLGAHYVVPAGAEGRVLIARMASAVEHQLTEALD